MSLSRLFRHFSCSFIIFKTTGGENQIWEVTYIFKIRDHSSPPFPPYVQVPHPPNTFEKRKLTARVLLICRRQPTHAYLHHFTAIVTTDLLRNSLRLGHLSRYSTFDSVMVLFKNDVS